MDHLPSNVEKPIWMFMKFSMKKLIVKGNTIEKLFKNTCSPGAWFSDPYIIPRMIKLLAIIMATRDT